MNRKEFITKSFRLGILTGMVGGTLFLVKRNKVDFSCSTEGGCRSCSLYDGCDLDKAKQSKNDER